MTLRIALAQRNFLVGDVAGNTARIVALLNEVRSAGTADLVVFPELALCGYPPEDLLLHAGFRRQVTRAVDDIVQASQGIAAVVGYPEYGDGCIYNSAAFVADGRVLGNYRKQCLPNYSVFDEQRYFTAGEGPVVVHFRGRASGSRSREDVWSRRRSGIRERRGRLIAVPRLALRDAKKARERCRDAPSKPPADRLSEPGRRAGRAGVRWRFLRRGRGGVTVLRAPASRSAARRDLRHRQWPRGAGAGVARAGRGRSGRRLRGARHGRARLRAQERFPRRRSDFPAASIPH